jgi:transcriptional regulator with XRE-family HTH domain
MPAQWTGDMVGKMHNNKITLTQVAEKIGVTKAYVCMVLNGHRNPKGAEQRFMAALDELIKEKEGWNE